MVYDLVLKNTTYVNLFTKETYPADIAVQDGRIAHVTQPGQPGLCGRSEYDAKGKYAVPGLIDTHLHIESSMMSPRHFARALAPHGTTTVCADPHEIGNVMGLEGIRLMLEATEGLPLRVLLLAPSCVPSVPGVETSRTAFGQEEIAWMLAQPRVVGLGEVMDYQGVVNGAPRMEKILQTSRDAGAFIQGHAPDLAGEELSRYLAAGCESDHETHREEEALEKLRAGMVLEVRHASNCFDLERLLPLLLRLDCLENVTFCTDDTEPRDLMERGHLDEMIRIAVRGGMKPIEAIKVATVNAARLARLRDRGSLCPGSLADILLVPDLADFRPDEVFLGGELIAKEGRMLAEEEQREKETYPNTMLLKTPIRPEDFRVAAQGGTVKLHTIAYDSGDKFVTALETCEFPVENGWACIGDQPDFALFAVFERHGRNGGRALAPVHRLGLAKGAVATTVSHDCHNLFVAGRDPDEMYLAASTLAATGGGIVCVEDGRVIYQLELPLAGLMCDEPPQVMAEKLEELKAILTRFGIPGHTPHMLLSSFALAVIPAVRLTDRGLVDTIRQELIPLYAD